MSITTESDDSKDKSKGLYSLGYRILNSYPSADYIIHTGVTSLSPRVMST